MNPKTLTKTNKTTGGRVKLRAGKGVEAYPMRARAQQSIHHENIHTNNIICIKQAIFRICLYIQIHICMQQKLVKKEAINNLISNSLTFCQLYSFQIKLKRPDQPNYA